MKKFLNVILLTCIALLLYICYDSIMSPIRFDEERKRRETAVVARLTDIRKAQEEYYRGNDGKYTDNFDSLISYIKAHRPASGTLLSYHTDIDSIRYIPYGEGAQFEIDTLSQTTASGHVVSLLEVRAPYETYLNGLDKREINQLRERQESMGQYAGLKTGSLEKPNNHAGNRE